MLYGPYEHLRLFIVTRYMDRDKWLNSTEWCEIIIGEMVVDFSPPHDFHIITQLVEDASDREEHEWYVYPELIEVYIVSYPCFVSDHDYDIDQDEYGK